MKLSYLVFFLFILLFAWGYPSDGYSRQNSGGYYFYTPAEIRTMQQSARTPWGKEIAARLQAVVNERQQHPMEVPVLEGGHGHDYFCPVHNTPFTFDWNSPQAHYCPACGKHWKGTARYDWAWVNHVHNANLRYLSANRYLFLLTGDTVYARNIARLLLDYAGKYPGYVEHDRERKLTTAYSGRMFAQSLDEAVWAVDAARAYVVAAPAMTSQEKQRIETGYLRICAGMLANRYDKGNWQVWHNSALAALGIALKNDSILETALHKPVSGYHAMLRKNVYPDGWWNEGSAVYHFYPLRALMLTAEAVRCRGIDLYDQTLHTMFMAPVNLLYPDLTFPSQNDGWYGISLVEQASLYEIASLRYDEPLFRELLAACYRKTTRSSPEALINGKTLPGRKQPLPLKSHLFPDLGTALLRSGDATAVIKFGPSGGIHGHPDKLTLSLHNGKEEIVPDLGTTAYGVPDCHEWYRRTFAHSTVTVDQTDQRPATGKLLYFRPAEQGGEVAVQTDSVYPGVTLQRTIKLDGNRLTDRFVCRSDSAHTYDYVLILTHPVIRDGVSDSLIAAAYTRLQEVKKSTAGGEWRFDTPQASVTIRVRPTRKFDVISGVAPGIPPTQSREGKPAYPLIIRTKGKIATIETHWVLKK